MEVRTLPGLLLVDRLISGSFNGKTADSESANAGSIPAPGTKEERKRKKIKSTKSDEIK